MGNAVQPTAKWAMQSFAPLVGSCSGGARSERFRMDCSASCGTQPQWSADGSVLALATARHDYHASCMIHDVARARYNVLSSETLSGPKIRRDMMLQGLGITF